MFRGSMVALVTPFIDHKIDEDKLRGLVDVHIHAKTQALVVAGTTGEAGTLSWDEKLHIIKIVVDEARERIPVIAGTGLNATQDCLRLTQEAMALGVHAALIMTPAYIRPTQEGLFQHYSQIAKQVALPIILYNVPGRTGCDLLPETVGRLSSISNIIGVKEAVADLDRLKALLKYSDGRVDVFGGDDAMCAEWMLQGAKGVISVTANVAPLLMVQLSELALKGDKKACLSLQKKLMPLHHMMFVESNPIPVKWALGKMGYISSEMRLPLLPLSSNHHVEMIDALKKLDLI